VNISQLKLRNEKFDDDDDDYDDDNNNNNNNNGPWAHPASYTMGTGSLPGVKRPGRGVDHPLHLAPRLKKE
jgi:hypothetical protein